ncbi:hypothetical protein BAL199_26267 [alpha proteobacterium BAL199]|nr:hypothetical protein BAL199_26267 [alpha proteobacterium BAL199]
MQVEGYVAAAEVPAVVVRQVPDLEQRIANAAGHFGPPSPWWPASRRSRQ